MEKIIIDGNNLIVGRMATFVAKNAILGKSVEVVNCENCVFSGSKESVLEKYRTKLHRGIPAKGPFFYRRPDMFVRRCIRGMITYKKGRGKIAYSNIKCHIGVPEVFKNEKIQTLENADYTKNPSKRTVDYIKVSLICKLLGWRG